MGRFELRRTDTGKGGRQRPAGRVSRAEDPTAPSEDALLSRRVEQLAALYELTTITGSAADARDIFRAALDTLERCLGVARASILLVDPDGVMRFKSWRGISEAYRRSVEGHSPWTPGDRPEPVMVPDAAAEPALERFQGAILEEGIRSLAFIPLLHHGRLLGKFMVYGDAPRRYTSEEIRVAEIIATHVSFAIHRQQTEAEREKLLVRERTARLEAEQASRVKDDFLATLSHELRTPLTSILGWARLLEGGGLDPTAARKAIRTIERNADNLSGLINDLLDVSRIRQGALRLDTQPLDLPSVLQVVTEILRPAAEAKDIRVHLCCTDVPALVQGDPGRMQQIFWNLLSNAIRFTPRGGSVQVLVERSDGDVVCRVEDSGEGIPPDFLPRMFEPFQQADAGSRRRSGGLGLGLSIVRQLVELHGGTVDAESGGPGRGAAFTVRIPANAEPPGAHRPQPARPPRSVAEAAPVELPRFPDLSGLDVLIVEDEPDSREFLAVVLRKCGASVREAGSVAEALRHFRAHRPDVLVSDIAMPEEDGFDLIRAVRREEETGGPAVQAVALTGFAGDDDRRRALEAGFQRHLSKPIDPFRLALLVGEVASSR